MGAQHLRYGHRALETTVKTDIQIAQEADLRPIQEIAEKVGLTSDDIVPFGHYKAKIPLDIAKQRGGEDGRLILVTGISPTAAGEGKSTVSVGLADALSLRNRNPVLCLREPSLGPVFGIKGGAAGGGYSQVVPMEDINLHFNGDFHAISSAHGLLSAVLDNHLYRPNTLGIDPTRITWPRAVDMNDRALRSIVVGLGGRTGGVPRQDSFVITAASEIMAIFSLADGIDDLKARLERIIIGTTRDGEPIRAGGLGVSGAMAVLLKDAINPNLVQTLGGTPALIHGGPFANIAHGCNSLSATREVLRHQVPLRWPASRCGGRGRHRPRAEDERRSGQGRTRSGKRRGRAAGLRQPARTHREREEVRRAPGRRPEPVRHRQRRRDRGDRRWLDLADAVWEVLESGEADYRPLYPDDMGLVEKIETVATEIYGAAGVDFAGKTRAELAALEEAGLGDAPVCIAKTQYSFSDDATLLGRPTGFRITVAEVTPSAGAGFVVAKTGSIMTMPGLGVAPSAMKVDVTDGVVTGLF